MSNEAEASTEQGMLRSMSQSGVKSNKAEVKEYLRNNDMHADALSKSQDRLASYRLDEEDGYATSLGPIDAGIAFTPGAAPFYTAAASVGAELVGLLENVPQLAHGVGYDMRNQFLNPGEFPATAQAWGETTEDLEKWEQRLGTKRFDYEDTPGNRLMRVTGELTGELAWPVLAKGAKVVGETLRSPMGKMGKSFDEIGRTASPEFNQSRRDVMRNTAVGGVAVGLPVGVHLMGNAASKARIAKNPAGHANRALSDINEIEGVSKWSDSVVKDIYGGDPLSRPEYSRVFREKGAHGNYNEHYTSPISDKAAQRLARFDKEYDINQAARAALGEEKYLDYKKLENSQHLPYEEEVRVNAQLVSKYGEDEVTEMMNPNSFIRSRHFREANRFTPKNKARIDAIKEQQARGSDDYSELNATRYESDGGVSPETKEAFANIAKADRSLQKEMDEILRTDPIRNAYNAKRKAAFLEQRGNEVFNKAEVDVLERHALAQKQVTEASDELKGIQVNRWVWWRKQADGEYYAQERLDEANALLDGVNKKLDMLKELKTKRITAYTPDDLVAADNALSESKLAVSIAKKKLDVLKTQQSRSALSMEGSGKFDAQIEEATRSFNSTKTIAKKVSAKHKLIQGNSVAAGEAAYTTPSSVHERLFGK